MNVLPQSIEMCSFLDLHRKSKICCVIGVISASIVELDTSVMLSEVSWN